MAKAKNRTKAAAAAVPVPQNITDANRMVRELGITQRELRRIETNMADELAAVRERHEAAAAPHKRAAEDMLNGLQIWATANREAITNGGKVKFCMVPAGKLEWRNTPPSVTVRGAERVLELLKEKWKKAFIRTKEEINKEAILDSPKDHAVRSLPGITINNREEFIVTPHDAELAQEAAA